MRKLHLLTVIILWALSALAAENPPGLLTQEATEEAAPIISLLTAHAGPEIYQLEGHSALRIVEPGGADYVVNWGLFDFDAPNFVYRFVKGETDYMAGECPTPYFLALYAREGRKVVEQVLDLSPEEAREAVNLIRDNLRPENRVYRYNYVVDNCATRPLAIVERAIGDTLTLVEPPLPVETRKSFRNAMRHYHENYPWYQFGIDLALGSNIDKKIDRRAMAFSPEALEQMMAGGRHPSGRPIVRETRVIVDSPASSAILSPTPFLFTPLFWSIIVLFFSIIASISQLYRRDLTLFARLFDTVYFSLAGLAGLTLTFLIFISIHEAASPNWLYLWLNPACFAGAVLVWSKRWKKLLKSYQFVNFALLIVLAIALCCGVQSPNPAFIPLIAADAVRALSCIVVKPTVFHRMTFNHGSSKTKHVKP